MESNYGKIVSKLKNLSAKKSMKKRFSKIEKIFIYECKKSKLNQVKSWATELIPNKQSPRKRKNSISGFFEPLGRGRAAIQYAIKNV